MSEWVNVAEIARMMGRSKNNVWQYARRRREYDEGKRPGLKHPMPAPIPQSGDGRMWNKAEIEAWISERETRHIEAGHRYTRRQSLAYPGASGKLLEQALSEVSLEPLVAAKQFASQPAGNGNVHVELKVLATMDASRFERILRESRR